MASVLVVDDEIDFRTELRDALLRAGHTAYCASNGRSGIDLGIRHRPELLIVDWMLKDSIDGLAVFDTLRVVDPTLRTILVTGYATADLRLQTEFQEGFRFVEKPYSLNQIWEAMDELGEEQGGSNEGDPSPIEPIGVFEFDSTGNILYANPWAIELLSPAFEPQAAVQQVFPDLPFSDLVRSASSRWSSCTPNGCAQERTMRIRALPDCKEYTGVILDRQAQAHQSNPLVQLLLDEQPVISNSWPFNTHLLLLDSQQLSRRIAVESLRRAGCICHSASSLEEVLSLIGEDPLLQVVVLDDHLGFPQLRDTVKQLRKVLPTGIIIGSGRTETHDELIRGGVDYYLPKPWSVSDLVTLLTRERMRSELVQ